MSYEIDEFSEAIRQNFDWSMQLADTLAADGKWDVYPWHAFINTWSSMELDLDQHRRVFEWLERTELYSSHGYQVADALYALVRNDGPSYATDMLPQANRIAPTLWTTLDRSLNLEPVRGWFDESKNYPVWGLTNFWLSSADLWWKSQNPRPTTLSDTYKQVFSEIINDQSHIGSLAKSILAADLLFLLHADEDWTKHNLLQLFDPCSENFQSENFQAVWDGFLAKGRLYTHVAEAMTDLFLKAATRINTHLFNQRKGFVRFYTVMLIKYPQYTQNPLCDWIPKLFVQDSKIHPSQNSKLKSLGSDDYTTSEYFIFEIGRYFQNLDEDEKRELWRRWLKDYWQNRLDGVPIRMTAKEAKHMLDWLVDLKDLFPEGVELAIQMPPPSLDNTRIPAFLVENRTWESHPQEVARLLIYLCKCSIPPHYRDLANDIVDALIGSDISSELLPDLEDIRAQLTD